MANNFKPTTIF